MEQMCPRVKNYHVSVKEVDKTIVFLRGWSGGNGAFGFGIHVARMAGMPASVVARAEEIPEESGTGIWQQRDRAQQEPSTPRPKSAPRSSRGGGSGDQTRGMQLSMFRLDDPVLVQIRDQIKGLDINALSLRLRHLIN